MAVFFAAINLMLVASAPSTIAIALTRPLHDVNHTTHSYLGAREQPTPTMNSLNNIVTDSSEVAIEHSLQCDQANGTTISANNSSWTLLCDIDFTAQDIYPFILAKSFQKCMQYCENHNSAGGGSSCAGFVYAPDRSNLDNDCYLKSSVSNSVYPATIHLIGATLNPKTTATRWTQPINPINLVPTSTVSSIESIVTPPKSNPTTVEMSLQEEPISEATEGTIKSDRVPTITKSTYLGTAVDEVASQYVSHVPSKPQQLAAGLFEPGINTDLITLYPLASDTGAWTGGDVSVDKLANMTVSPRVARDGGRGGNINGTNIFIFCDTSTYGKDADPVLGYFNGFVSSSVAVDENMYALNGQPLKLTNSLGQWQDDVGRMRGWVPMTTGEEAFNTAVSGKGYRYAVWPNSSPIPLNQTHAIMYAPLVYLEVDMQDQSSPRYTSLGNTLLLISIDPVYGPHASRLHSQFFNENEVGWGSLGGVRAWTSDGRGLSTGDIYVFGGVDRGVLIGKVPATDFDNVEKYTYWNGETWSRQMPSVDSSSKALLIDQPVMNMDLIYSPAHKTFILIYLTPEADNTFYYRYLVGKNNESLIITPPYETDGHDQYVENVLTNVWSDSKVLFKIPTPERGYAYAGGIHAGYFDEDDITMGGMKMLCTWTEHTRVDPDKPESGYALKAEAVEFGWAEK